jgi:diaminopimelate epimerase
MLVEQKITINMPINFLKMNAMGNDFVIIDQRLVNYNLSVDSIKKISNRKNIGCDQFIVIENSKNSLAKVFMKIFNTDGSISATCGNATRCVASLLFEENPQLLNLFIETSAGLLECFKISNNLIKVNLGIPKIISENISLFDHNFIHIDIGNPHAVSFVKQIPHDDIFFEIAPKIENNTQIFPNKTNVEFAQIIDDSTIRVRVFERGVGETSACGSGACAVAVASIFSNLITKNSVKIIFSGGELLIDFDGKFVYMTGSFLKIFSGEIYENFLS